MLIPNRSPALKALIWTLLVVIAFRAVIPTGFMPKLEVTNFSEFGLTFCPGHRGSSALLEAIKFDPANEKQQHELQGQETCLFNLHNFSEAFYSSFYIEYPNLYGILLTVALKIIVVLFPSYKDQAPRAPPISLLY